MYIKPLFTSCSQSFAIILANSAIPPLYSSEITENKHFGNKN
jgi:hypothetical protein